MIRRHLKLEHVQYQCDCCQIGFNSVMAHVVHKNKRHAIWDSENKAVICSVCSKSFPFLPSLLSHVRIDHFNFHPYTCQKCPKEFDTLTRLNSHIKSVHATELKFVCEFPNCDAKYTTSSSLYFHKKTTHSEACFVCEECGKTFKLKTKLNEHVKDKHGNNQVFVCDICGKSGFNSLKSAKVHEKNHKQDPAICTIDGCGKVFGRKRLLKIHIDNVTQ